MAPEALEQLVAIARADNARRASERDAKRGVEKKQPIPSMFSASDLRDELFNLRRAVRIEDTIRDCSDYFERMMTSSAGSDEEAVDMVETHNDEEDDDDATCDYECETVSDIESDYQSCLDETDYDEREYHDAIDEELEERREKASSFEEMFSDYAMRGRNFSQEVVKSRARFSDKIALFTCQPRENAFDPSFSVTECFDENTDEMPFAIRDMNTGHSVGVQTRYPHMAKMADSYLKSLPMFGDSYYVCDWTDAFKKEAFETNYAKVIGEYAKEFMMIPDTLDRLRFITQTMFYVRRELLESRRTMVMPSERVESFSLEDAVRDHDSKMCVSFDMTSVSPDKATAIKEIFQDDYVDASYMSLLWKIPTLPIVPNDELCESAEVHRGRTRRRRGRRPVKKRKKPDKEEKPMHIPHFLRIREEVYVPPHLREKKAKKKLEKMRVPKGMTTEEYLEHTQLDSELALIVFDEPYAHLMDKRLRIGLNRPHSFPSDQMTEYEKWCSENLAEGSTLRQALGYGDEIVSNECDATARLALNYGITGGDEVIIESMNESDNIIGLTEPCGHDVPTSIDVEDTVGATTRPTNSKITSVFAIDALVEKPSYSAVVVWGSFQRCVSKSADSVRSDDRSTRMVILKDARKVP